MKSLIPLIALLLWSGCTAKRQSLQTDTVNSKTAISFCVPKKAELNTEPGYDGSLVPLFAGLDRINFKITTALPLVQQYFNQGLILSYGFNHSESARAFREAIRLDPGCAMCHWGLAYVIGPNYNAPMDPAILPVANEAVKTAQLLSGSCTAKEQALIAALAKRYPQSPEDDPQVYYRNYASAMKELVPQFPQDADIAAMAAEALMDLHPWDLWTPEKEPKAWTPEILTILESVLTEYPEHPQAIHLYIHAMEAGNAPEKALPFADRLRDLVPGSGHLVHMPSHIYINTGHYHEGTLVNERAVVVDSHYMESCNEHGVYGFSYYPHNIHFLAACAALEGRGKRALKAARFMSEYVLQDSLLINDSPLAGTLQHFYSIPWYIQVKFGQWQQILHESRPDDRFKYPLAIWHYARGMAFANRNQLLLAQKELEAVKQLEKEAVLKEMGVFGGNSLHQLVLIAEKVLEGEMARFRDDMDQAATLFQEAVLIEDQLAYNEPPDWFFSVRHHLGNVLLESNRLEEAIAVYEEDLKNLKENGWALIGLYQAHSRIGDTKNAQLLKARYEKAWQWAEAPIIASVY